MTDEVLVHISTPATKQNDSLYQSLSRAYLQFEPRSRYTLEFRREQHEQQEPTTPQTNPLPAAKDGCSSSVAADPLISPTSHDSYGSFPSYLSTDAYAQGYSLNDIQTRHGSLEDGSIPTGSRLAQLERIHMNWKEQSSPGTSFMDGARRSRQTPHNSNNAPFAFIDDTQLAVQALQSQLLDTYSTTSEDTSGDDVGPGDEIQGCRLSVADDSRQDVGRNTIEESPAPRLKAHGIVKPSHQGQLVLDNTLNLPLPVSQVGLDVPSQVHNTGASLGFLDFSALPVHSFPPAPQISVAQPGRLPSQITEYLAAIKKQNPTRFKPSKKLRNPKLDERGYWSLDCSSWPDRMQHKFWISLSECVMAGQLGWGSTLHRHSEASTRGVGQVKLYCWGETVEHMWLVLWLYSKGRVTGSRSKWYDADGIAVLEVQ